MRNQWCVRAARPGHCADTPPSSARQQAVPTTDVRYATATALHMWCAAHDVKFIGAGGRRHALARVGLRACHMIQVTPARYARKAQCTPACLRQRSSCPAPTGYNVMTGFSFDMTTGVDPGYKPGAYVMSIDSINANAGAAQTMHACTHHVPRPGVPQTRPLACLHQQPRPRRPVPTSASCLAPPTPVQGTRRPLLGAPHLTLQQSGPASQTSRIPQASSWASKQPTTGFRCVRASRAPGSGRAQQRKHARA